MSKDELKLPRWVILLEEIALEAKGRKRKSLGKSTDKV